jgi:hypothetical protein
MTLTFIGAAVVIAALTASSSSDDDGAWLRPRCVVCRCAIDPTNATVDGDGGGYIPFAFTGEAPSELWVHYRCLAQRERATDHTE